MTTVQDAAGGRVGGSPSFVPSLAALLDVNSVAKLLGCSPRHVWRLNDSGAMPQALRLGALRRWSRATIEEWIAAGCPSCRKGGAR